MDYENWLLARTCMQSIEILNLQFEVKFDFHYINIIQYYEMYITYYNIIGHHVTSGYIMLNYTMLY